MAKKDIMELIRRYEQKLMSGKSVYLDANEFDELAEYFDSLNDIDSAREVVNAGLSIHPDSSSLLLKQARFYVYDGCYTEALSIINKSSTQYDFDSHLLRIECFLQVGLNAEAHALVSEIFANEKEDLDNVLAEIGFLYVEADLFEEAILYFEKSLSYNQDNKDVLSDLSYAYEMLGNYDAAIKATDRILDLDSYTYEAWINLGKLYSMQDAFDKAVDAFDFAYTINDSDNNTLKLKAHCLSLCGRTQEAIDIFEELLKASSVDTSIYFLLAECYQTLEMYDKSLFYLVKYGEVIDAISTKTSSLIEEDNLEAALDIVKQGLDKDQYSVELNLIAGDIRFRQGLYNDAEGYFLRAYSVKEDSILILDRLSVVAIKQEKFEDAICYTQELLYLDINNLVVKQRLALLHFEVGDARELNNILDQFSDDELSSLFQLIYTFDQYGNLSRSEVINYLLQARENRILFKNLKY